MRRDVIHYGRYFDDAELRLTSFERVDDEVHATIETKDGVPWLCTFPLSEVDPGLFVEVTLALMHESHKQSITRYEWHLERLDRDESRP